MAQEVVSIAVVARRMCDMLQLFPSAAMSGVRWQTLVRKYQERYSARLDIASLGYASPLDAAIALLWEVARVVDSGNADNPLLVIEDEVALMPQPGFLATWPSLHLALCRAVGQHGTVELTDSAAGQEPTRSLLLSQLRTKLQENWHPNFSESSLTYLNEDGSGTNLKKMKHVVQAVLRFRNQHASQVLQCAGRADMREALSQELQLVPSKKHNDLELQIVRTEFESAAQTSTCVQSCLASLTQGIHFEASNGTANASASGVSRASAHMHQEIAEQEIAALKVENSWLQQRLDLFEQRQRTDLVCFERNAGMFTSDALESDLLDHPFEPPPEKKVHWVAQSPAPTVAGSSIADPTDFGFSSGYHSPRSALTSGTATPMRPAVAAGFQYHGGSGLSAPFCAFVPVWFERTKIPSGIVQETRACFERADGMIPSFFTQS